MSRIKSVIIRRFKQLETVELPLGDATLLIGANNSGKSSILQAIHFAVSIAQSARLVGEDLSWANDKFQMSFNPAQLIYSPVSDVLSLATGGRLREEASTQIEVEFLADDGTSCTVTLRRGRNRNIQVAIIGKQLGDRLMGLEHPFTVYAPGLAGVPKEERYLSPGVVRRFVARGDANLTLRNVLRMLHKNAKSWDEFLQDMRSMFPNISITIHFDENTDENIQVHFQLSNGQHLPLDAAGTSVLQASQILAYISLFKPQVLILDEPDSHLHPDNQRTLCDLIYRLTSIRNFQAIISTHSRHVLDTMKSKSQVVWLSKGRVVKDSDVNETAMLLDLGALDSADYFADGENRCVVATEDTYREPLSALLWSNGFVEEDTKVESYAGCSKMDAALFLGRFLQEKASHVHLVIHRDRDYLSDDASQRFVQKLEQLGNVGAFLTEPNDIEGYFLNAQHLNYLNPMVSVKRMDELLTQATQEMEVKSIEAIVNQRTAEAFRKKQEGGTGPNHGAIAVEAQADYNANPTSMRRGDIVLGRFQALLQEELGNNPKVFHPSPYLQSVKLKALSSSIWPQTATGTEPATEVS